MLYCKHKDGYPIRDSSMASDPEVSQTPRRLAGQREPLETGRQPVPIGRETTLKSANPYPYRSLSLQPTVGLDRVAARVRSHLGNPIPHPTFLNMVLQAVGAGQRVDSVFQHET